MTPRYLARFLFLPMLTLAGCASLETPPSAFDGVLSPAADTGLADFSYAADEAGLGNVRLKVDSSLPSATGLQQPLVNGLFSASAPDQLIGYSASYQVKSGDSLKDETEPSSAPPVAAIAPLGGEYLGHSVSSHLPDIGGAPVLINLQDQYQNLLTASGGTAVQKRNAQVSWAPKPARFNVQWSDAADTAVPEFDCGLKSSVIVPTDRAHADADALRLSARNCRVVAPNRGVPDLGVNAWTAAWQWQGGAGKSDVHLTMMDPQRNLPGPRAAGGDPGREAIHSDGRGFELGASRVRHHGGYAIETAAGVRRVAAVESTTSTVDWTARTTLSRQYEGMKMSACWRTQPTHCGSYLSRNRAATSWNSASVSNAGSTASWPHAMPKWVCAGSTRGLLTARSLSTARSTGISPCSGSGVVVEGAAARGPLNCAPSACIAA